MSLADALRDPPRRPNRPCRMATIMSALSDEDRGAVATALDDPRFTTSHIHRELVANGYDLGRTGVEVHRKGNCSCRSRTP